MPGPITATKPYSKGRYVITGKSGQSYLPTPGTWWRIPEETFLAMDAEGRISWGASGDGRPLIQRYLSEVGDLVPRTIWHYRDVGSTRQAKNEMKALYPDSEPFDTPKPERLLERILRISTQPGDTVLDFGRVPPRAHPTLGQPRWSRSPRSPSPCQPLPGNRSGRGLFAVAGLSQRWFATLHGVGGAPGGATTAPQQKNSRSW